MYQMLKKMNQKYLYTGILLASLALQSCKNEPILNPNAPTLDELMKNPTIGELNNLVTGIEGSSRASIGLYIDVIGVLGRECYRYQSTEPRYTGALLGQASDVLGNTDFYSNTPWNARYNNVKGCNLLLEGVDKSKYPNSDQNKRGYRAFALTFKAHELLYALNMTDENGIRLEVTDPYKPGPIVNKAEALTAIAKMLDDAYAMLPTAEFGFTLSSGFKDYNTPATFGKFNRAIAARVAIYRQQWAAAITMLGNSYLDHSATANLNSSPLHLYSEASGDRINDVYCPNTGGDIRMAHPSYSTDVEPGDDRLAKSTARTAPRAVAGLPECNRNFRIYATNVTSIPFCRNEELMLYYAEAKAQTNEFAEAARVVNIIRTRHGIAARPNDALDTKDELIDEILKQRRWSLWGEGHRWIDMRRYNRLNQLPIDRAGDDVWTKMPLPEAETSF